MTLGCSGLRNGQSRVISFCPYCLVKEIGAAQICAAFLVAAHEFRIQPHKKAAPRRTRTNALSSKKLCKNNASKSEMKKVSEPIKTRTGIGHFCIEYPPQKFLYYETF